MTSLIDRIKHLSKRIKTILAVVTVLVLVVLVGGGLVLTNTGLRQSVLGLSGNLSGAAVTAAYADQALVHACYRATDGTPMHLWYDTAWKQESMGAGGWQTAVAPACVSWGPHEIDMFARGLDNKMYHRSWNGSSWSGWGALGTPSSSVTIAGTPAAVSRGPGHSEVFVRGSDKAVWHRGYHDTTPYDHVRNGTWSNWESLGLETNDDVAVVSRQADRLEVLARGTNNKLYHKWWDGSWHGWDGFDDSTDMASAPTVASRVPDQMEVYWKNSSGKVMRKQYLDGSWQAPTDLSAQFTGRPSPVSNGADRVDYFWRDSSNVLKHRTWSPDNIYSAINDVGITVGSDPSVAASNRSVEWQFAAIPTGKGKPLAFIFAKDSSGNYIGDDASRDYHYQVIQRKDYNGTPYFFLMRNENEKAGELLVVKMGSKANVTGPMGTNRANSTGAPDGRDTTVKSYHFDGNNNWPLCYHPGSGQIAGNVLVLPVEGGCTRGIVLLDIADPANITPTKYITTYTQGGNSVNYPDDASAVVGVFQQSSAYSNKWLFAFTSWEFNGSKALRFLESNSATLDANTTLTYVSAWNKDNLQNDDDCGLVINCGRFRCGLDCISRAVNWQTINFVKDPLSSSLYLITFDNGGTYDVSRLFKVERSNSTFTLTYKGQCHVDSGNPTQMGNWTAGAGAFVSPDNQLSLYMTGHDNEGPVVNGRSSIHAGEFSYYNGVEW